MKRQKRGQPQSRSSLTAFGSKKARTETLTEATENTNEPAEIEHDDSDIDSIGTTSGSATVSVSISQTSQCVTIQSTSASTTASVSTTSSNTTCHTSTDGASITITVYNDISNSKDNDPVQPLKSSFPKKVLFGKMRSFQTTWYKEFPFIEYSRNNVAVYCFCCHHFPLLSGKHEDAFLSGFSNWHKAVENLRKQ